MWNILYSEKRSSFVELVADLVDALVEEVGVQQDLPVGPVSAKPRRAGDGHRRGP